MDGRGMDGGKGNGCVEGDRGGWEGAQLGGRGMVVWVGRVSVQWEGVRIGETTSL